ncbi:flagellar hook protein FlgE [Paracoccus laeviglucosivorans]|uniref:Flagellar hook protein FlgE n=1 Tax=Paracoccus laeviglucosivorans TaxID=1197861 RepID=A0A521DSU8_9RHOB|nr:flagellar hook-basal body complex protein [Paracoccus laeviglucosivorans]SMO74833.1 flagellar hook protein FlgE [Paracoccus laeviglucosivorans]
MSISSALSAGVSGLAANSARLAGISDNIANSGTYGYKRVSTDFESIVIGDARGGGRYTAGGVQTSTSRAVDQRGSLIGTSHPLDIAITGRGMLPVINATQLGSLDNSTPLMMTRTGAFRTDEEGVLRTASGLVLMGWPANRDGTFPAVARDSTAALQPIVLNSSDTFAEPTTRIGVGFNLPAEATVGGGSPAPSTATIEYYDNLGATRNLTMTFTPTVGAAGTGRSNSWTVEIRDSATADDPVTAADESLVGSYELEFDDAPGGPLANVTTLSGGAYDPVAGALTVGAARGPITISIGTPGAPGGLTQISSDFSPTNVTKNGTQAGVLAAVEIDENGYLRATYDNGATRTLFQVPLVDVPNPNGLIALDSQTYEVSPQSGAFFLWDAGDGPTGSIAGYAREGSTTDVAAELTDLIQTQRAYSSNAKIIQTVDEMLQETTNIKR